ncbi:TetR/AcrR family transcriptional regulator [Mycobacterium sp. NPDC050853]|uniref:TetR/AcrR family transcriptional regulator n=1 Tax=Mycobacterium sp. NPDC050853 TaxID=3155160 RepID=UPI00340CC140
MAPERKHTSDAILDAVRALLLGGGPRAATIAAIASASGAPPGTLNHRFGNREAILSATWLRAVERFHEHAFGALRSTEDSVEVAVALALSVPAFARACPDDARLLLSLRSTDVLGADAGSRLDEMNEPLFSATRDLTRAVYGRADARSRDRLMRAVVDLPYAAVRRHMPTLPGWLEEDLAAAVRHLLAAHNG